MSIKETVLDCIRRLPADATYDEIIDMIEILAAIEQGRHAAQEGRCIPQEEFRRQSLNW